MAHMKSLSLVSVACLAMMLFAGNAQAVQALDCAATATCETQFGGTIQVGEGGVVNIPVQFVPSSNPQQPDTFWINTPGMPQNLTVEVPQSISLSGFIGFKIDPWLMYDLTFDNNSDLDLIVNLLWQPDVVGAPFHTGVATFEAIVSGTTAVGTAGPNMPGGSMQTVTFGGTQLSLGSAACSGHCGPFSTSTYWQSGVWMGSMDVALNFTLSPHSTAEFKGFAGLDTPEPASFLLLGAGMTAIGFALRRRRA